MSRVLWFDEIGSGDTASVGGKSANLGVLANEVDVPVLPGFATTAEAYDDYIRHNDLDDEIRETLSGIDTHDTADLRRRGSKIRSLILGGEMPDDLRDEIAESYSELSDRLGVENPGVAVRSSATAEDLPGASFAGQQETFLNISGEEEVVESVKGCYASLFTDRAISYREDKGFDHLEVKLSAAVQKMGNAGEGVSGVTFTIDPDTGFENALVINASYGFGDLVVQGEINPDEFTVFKQNLGIIERRLGDKQEKLVRREGENVSVEVPDEDSGSFCVSDERVREVAEYGMRVGEHYGRPMDVEWILDGDTDEVFVIQARPETVESERDPNVVEKYRLRDESEVLSRGSAVGSRIGAGVARVLESPEEIDEFGEDEVLVTSRTDPDWEPIMKKAAAIVTDKGGRTSHAAIVSRELGIPAVIGTDDGTSVIETGDEVTVDASESEGKVWSGILDFEVETHRLDEIPETDTEVLVNIGVPSKAFEVAQLPVDGVGLAREEFIISSEVGVHPLKLMEEGREDEYVESLRSGVGKIGAAFYPDDVVLRLSDFKSDEYAELRGGDEYETEESNPMLGFRGAARYYDDEFSAAFELECRAIRKAIDSLGLDNLKVMVPFCRTVEEGERVREKMKEYGLDEGDMDIYVMAEVPSNVVAADGFAQNFDGFSVGTNDLTQLTLGVDRNSDRLSELFDERDVAVKRSVRSLVEKAKILGLHTGICGDAPSTHEGYAEFLVETGIDSVSVSSDVALETILRVAEAEGEMDGTVESDIDMVGCVREVIEVLGEEKATSEELSQKTGMDTEDVSQALGWLLNENWVEVEKGHRKKEYSLCLY
ncbi:phosphoenolpyruvate synthase [Halorutilales archaeon Cl-col2-1]